MRSINPQLNFTQPVLIQLLALTAWMYVAMAAGPLVPAARAGAFASVSGGGADVDIPIDRFGFDSQPILTDVVERSDSGSNGSWFASAVARGPFAPDDPVNRSDNIILRT